jgi:hypothetical protein
MKARRQKARRQIGAQHIAWMRGAFHGSIVKRKLRPKLRSF